MKVILLQEMKGKGVEGDVVEVANGYANNYLLPRKMAVAATAGNLKQLEQRRHNIAKRETDRMTAAEGLKGQLDGMELRINARVGEEGQLFGSVTTQMIADALREQHNIEMDKKFIDLKAPIKTAGTHEATVSLHRDVKSTIVLLVGDLEAMKAAEEAKAAVAAKEAATAAASEAAAEDAEPATDSAVE